MDLHTDELPSLGEAACRALLAAQYVGRLGYVVDGRPVIVPVNYRVAEDETILVLSRPGTKLDVARSGAELCLQIDGNDDLRHSGWSVLATGTAEVIEQPEATEIAEQNRLRPWPKDTAGTALLRLKSTRVEGRRIR